MRYFGDMSEEEIAEYLSVSSRTVKRDWAMARAWLHAELISMTPEQWRKLQDLF